MRKSTWRRNTFLPGVPLTVKAACDSITGAWGCVVHEFSDQMTAEDIDRRLWLELTPEQYALVRELIRLEADAPIIGLLTETDRVVAALANHFRGIGPEIRSVAEQVIETGAIYEDGAPAEPAPNGNWRSGPASAPSPPERGQR